MCPSYSQAVHSVCLSCCPTQFRSMTIAPYFAFCGDVAGSKEFTKEQVSDIASLKLGGKSNREITIITGMVLRSV